MLWKYDSDWQDGTPNRPESGLDKRVDSFVQRWSMPNNTVCWNYSERRASTTFTLAARAAGAAEAMTAAARMTMAEATMESAPG